MRIITASIFVFLFSIRASLSQEAPIIKSGQEKLDPNATYYITYSCSTDDRRLSNYLTGLSTMFAPIKAATQVFAITSTDNLEATDFAKTSSISPKIVFTVEQHRGVVSKVNNDCNGSVIARGSDAPKLAYFLKFERQTLPANFAAVFALAKGILAPVYKIVRDKELSAQDQNNLEQIDNVLTAYNSYLALFTHPSSTVRTVNLKTGTTRLMTSVSNVVVKVDKVDSFLLSGIPFRANYNKLVDFKYTFEKQNLRWSCMMAQRALAIDGFAASEDRAYILYRSMEGNAFEGKKEIIECLGHSDLAPSVIKHRRLYPPQIPEDLLITEAELKAYVDELPKPAKADISPELLKNALLITNILGRGGKFNGILPADTKLLPALLSDQITINDNTSDLLLTVKNTPVGEIQPSTTETNIDQVAKLFGAGIKRFGCFSTTRSQTSLRGDLDGAAMMMLAEQRVEADGQVAKRIIGLRMFYEGVLLNRIDLTDNWIAEARSAYEGCQL